MKETLEQMIDSASLERVIDALAEICDEKEQHILEVWRDAPLASEWRKAAVRMQRAARSLREEVMNRTPGIQQR